MKRISALLAVLWVMFILVPSIGSAQSETEGFAIFKDVHKKEG